MRQSKRWIVSLSTHTACVRLTFLAAVTNLCQTRERPIRVRCALTSPRLGAGFSSPQGLALDASGNISVTNYGGASVSEVIGSAAPVLTPKQACLKKGKNVCVP